MRDVVPLIDGILPDVIALRHEIHAHPELGFEETETARRILEHLQPLAALRVRAGVARTGIIATLNADKPGRCVALRAELDALPLQEETGLPYASKHPGRMHACGHDGHMSCLVGAAKVLSQIGDEVPGKIKFIFQPAEEGGAGGADLCREGALEDPEVDAVFALHGWPELELGTIGVAPGPSMASMDSWTMKVRGIGGHAAYPHEAVDPIVVASQIVTALQTVASRSTDPLEAVVLTVGKFRAGTASNIIPPVAELAGTIRALKPAVRADAKAKLRHIAKRTAEAFGATAEIAFGTGYPVLENDAGACRCVEHAAGDVLGKDKCRRDVPPSMGAEDFAFYAERVPVAFYRLGISGPGDRAQPMLHQPTFDFPDAALPVGIRMHCEIARRFLSPS